MSILKCRPTWKRYGDAWLLLHAGALGDLALSLGLLLRLSGVRQAGVLLFSRSDLGLAGRTRPRVARIVGLDRATTWLHAELEVEPPSALHSLVRGRRVISLLDKPESRVHDRLRRLSPRMLLATDPRPDPDSSVHVTEQWRRRLERGGLPFDNCVYKRRGAGGLIVDERIRRVGRSRLLGAAQAAVRGREAPVAILCPGSGGIRKTWPLDGFLEVAGSLRAAGIVVVWLLGPVELESWAPATLARLRGDGGVIELSRGRWLMPLLAAADVIVANDSGPAHVAALLGTPVVSLFGPTDPAVWRPIGRSVHVIRGELASADPRWGVDAGRVVDAVLCCVRGIEKA